MNLNKGCIEIPQPGRENPHLKAMNLNKGCIEIESVEYPNEHKQDEP